MAAHDSQEEMERIIILRSSLAYLQMLLPGDFIRLVSERVLLVWLC